MGIDLNPAVLERIAEAEQDRPVEIDQGAGVAGAAGRPDRGPDPERAVADLLGRRVRSEGVGRAGCGRVLSEVEEADARPVDGVIGQVLESDPNQERPGAAAVP